MNFHNYVTTLTWSKLLQRWLYLHTCFLQINHHSILAIVLCIDSALKGQAHKISVYIQSLLKGTLLQLLTIKLVYFF
jgi:hypothetical protein